MKNYLANAQTLLLSIVLFLFTSHTSAAFEYKRELVDFFTTDSLRIKGILFLPQTPVKKIVVMLWNPQMNFLKSYNFSSKDSGSVHFKFSNNLLRNGIGLLVLGTRSSDVMSATYRQQTIFTLADDADAAIRYLKSRTELSSADIGVIGHSQAGESAAITASRNKDVKFMCFLSSFMTDGIINFSFSYGRMKVRLPRRVFLGSELLRSRLNDSTFTLNSIIYKNNANTFLECIIKTFDKINEQVVLKYYNYDSIVYEASKMMKVLWSDVKFRKEAQIKGNETPDNCIDLLIKLYYVPINIEQIKWVPQQYFSNIKCPTLILYGEKDKVLNIEAEVKAAKTLMNNYNKSNFDLMIFKDCDHSLYDKQITTKLKNGQTKKVNVASDEAILSIVSWINKH